MNLSHVFAGENVGVTQVGERIWLVTFMQYDLGDFDDETCRLEPIDNPFGPDTVYASLQIHPVAASQYQSTPLASMSRPCGAGSSLLS